MTLCEDTISYMYARHRSINLGVLLLFEYIIVSFANTEYDFRFIYFKRFY